MTEKKKPSNALAFFANMNDHALLELVESGKGKKHKGFYAILYARALRVAEKRGLCGNV